MPITVVAGFLGAGKTTLLNHILQHNQGLRVAVLVNDFGALNIDAALIEQVTEDTVQLRNGCICCSIRDDLLAAVLRLTNRPEPPEHVIIECSGVADPHAVIATFHTPRLRSLVRLHGVVTVVDAERIGTDNAYADLIEDQITAADLILLNKVDCTSVNLRQGVREWMHAMTPSTRVLETSYAALPPALFFDTLNATQAPHQKSFEPYEHKYQFTSWSYVNRKPFRTSALHQTLLALPEGVLRIKGILACTTPADQRCLLQGVGRRISLTPLGPWGDVTPTTQLVAIGLRNQLDSERLQAMFDGCLE